MGVCGCGKSTIARALAHACYGVFLDADDFHPPANIEKMMRGEPLDYADRTPWLATLASEISDSKHANQAIFLACSALKASYRDILTAGHTHVHFVHLTGPPELIRARLRARSDHFMPDTLIDSQFATLEVPDDAFSIDINSSVESIVTTIQQRFYEKNFSCGN